MQKGEEKVELLEEVIYIFKLAWKHFAIEIEDFTFVIDVTMLMMESSNYFCCSKFLIKIKITESN
jgi:hypothetical protein